jgi:GNAT superfamily N-acetyltransferase
VSSERRGHRRQLTLARRARPCSSSLVHTLRPARPTDLPDLIRLIDASVRGLSRGFYSPAQVESGLRFVFGPDTQLIDDGTYFVIEAEGGIVAAGGWSHRRTLYGGDQAKAGPDPELDPATEPARIRAFFVHPSHARRGLARMIHDRCVADARAHGFSAIELMATLPGEPLYRALGFEPLERSAPELPDGERLPMVRMRKRLAPR